MSHTAKRINKAEQEVVSELAQALRIPVTSDVWSYVEVGERWDERHDTSTNIVTIKLPRRDITFSFPAIVDLLGKCPHLAEVRLNHNDLGAGFPTTLPSTLERLYADNNPRLNGELPAAMKFRNLKVLWLTNCGMKGNIPYGIGDLWSLKQLYLAENNFEGRLPDTFATLPLLEVIDVRQNKLKGGIPRSFSRLDSIAQIDLSYNQFSGSIPIERFANMTNLNWLNLACNNFLDTASAHRELQAQMPNTIVKVHAPKKNYRPSPNPTFPRPRFRPLGDETKEATPSSASKPGGSGVMVESTAGFPAGESSEAVALNNAEKSGEEAAGEGAGTATAGDPTEAEGEAEDEEGDDEEGSEYEDDDEDGA